jgi:beta-lactamase regulating signal transducer with metallopeptidase domain
MSERFAALLVTGYAMPLLLVVKVTLALAAAWAVALLLPARAAAARHLVWTLAMGGLLLLPLATWGVPRLPLAVLPASGGTAADVTGAGGAAGHGALIGGPDAATGAGGSRGDVSELGPPASTAVERVAVASPDAMSFPALSPSALWILWALGGAAVLAWLLVGRVVLHVVRRRAVPLHGADWDAPYRDAAWLLETTRAARLYRSHSATMPVTWGVFRPVVLLPDDAESWPAERRRVVLLHELSHVVRRDCLTQLVAGLVCALYWFHPGVWYAARRMRVERERACDDLVLAAGTPAPDYAAHLLDMARRFRSVFPTPMVALHMARPSQLEGRLLAVLAGGSGRRPPTRGAIAIAALVALVLVLPLAALHPVAAEAAPLREQTGDAAPAADGARPDAAPARAEPPSNGGAARSAAVHAEPAPPPLDTPSVRQHREAGTARIGSSTSDSVARIIRRIPPNTAAHAITTRDGGSILLLRDATLVLQLTDRGLDGVARDDRSGDEGGGGFLSSLLDGMLRGGLRVLLDHAIEYSLSDVREARYEDGRLVIESVRGTDVFGDVNTNGGAIMAGFHARDARAFAARVNAARARLR